MCPKGIRVWKHKGQDPQCERPRERMRLSRLWTATDSMGSSTQAKTIWPCISRNWRRIIDKEEQFQKSQRLHQAHNSKKQLIVHQEDAKVTKLATLQLYLEIDQSHQNILSRSATTTILKLKIDNNRTITWTFKIQWFRAHSASSQSI